MTHHDCPSTNKLSPIAKAQGAMLGVAVGDALGWPQEDRSKRIDKRPSPSKDFPVKQFQQWVRRSGSRFYPYEEIIFAGEYSDDTQLLLCTARSLLSGPEWWHDLTKRELPAWILYERGAGGATKRSAQMWLAGQEPWSSPKRADRQRYFDAGGNGVAMRIMPHCLFDVSEADFGRAAKNIVINGVCTHGHPRSLVEALAYGFAMWMVLREIGTLSYRGIIEKVLSVKESWSQLPNLNDIWPTWRHSADETTAGKYSESWQEAVQEMVQLLECAQAGMRQGSLSIDQEILQQLGCFDRRTNGSGTIAAAAAIFLASRYAVDPLNGLIEAAFANGADTDTIASMTGGLLGAVHGSEWLQTYSEQVQDAQYLRTIGQHLSKQENINRNSQRLTNRISRQILDSFIKKLQVVNQGDTVVLPDGREAQAFKPEYYQADSKHIIANLWKLITLDGQSLYIKKISHIRGDGNRGTQESLSSSSNGNFNVEFESVEVVKVGIKILVRNMERSRLFYEKVMNLNVVKETSSSVSLGGIIALVSTDYEKGLGDRSENMELNKNVIIYIETRSLRAIYQNVEQFGGKVLSEIFHGHGRSFFRCLDPDKNVVEVSEMTSYMH
jgi:ADP-ribosylglycohydrolase/predicted enzyme related to lactoylglutathione lyase